MPLIKSPTLLISGSNDMFLDLLETTRSAIPRCRTQVIEEAGVLICLEKPKELAQAIIDFMNNPGA
jgi:pimeloyl-ACP methyl ester carboxylesterase